MIDTVRNFIADYQDWASTQSMSYGELAEWQNVIGLLASAVDDDGELLEELKENGVL